jgi:hypothetical protein
MKSTFCVTKLFVRRNIFFMIVLEVQFELHAVTGYVLI